MISRTLPSCFSIILHGVKMRKGDTIDFRFGGRSTTFCNSDRGRPIHFYVIISCIYLFLIYCAEETSLNVSFCFLRRHRRILKKTVCCSWRHQPKLRWMLMNYFWLLVSYSWSSISEICNVSEKVWCLKNRLNVLAVYCRLPCFYLLTNLLNWQDLPMMTWL